MPIKNMLEDPRQIDHVNNESAAFTVAAVGLNGVTKIVAYGENAEFCLVPWLAVYKGDEIAQRIAATGLSIYYAEQSEQGVAPK